MAKRKIRFPWDSARIVCQVHPTTFGLSYFFEAITQQRPSQRNFIMCFPCTLRDLSCLQRYHAQCAAPEASLGVVCTRDLWDGLFDAQLAMQNVGV